MTYSGMKIHELIQKLLEADIIRAETLLAL